MTAPNLALKLTLQPGERFHISQSLNREQSILLKKHLTRGFQLVELDYTPNATSLNFLSGSLKPTAQSKLHVREYTLMVQIPSSVESYLESFLTESIFFLKQSTNKLVKGDQISIADVCSGGIRPFFKADLTTDSKKVYTVPLALSLFDYEANKISLKELKSFIVDEIKGFLAIVKKGTFNRRVIVNLGGIILQTYATDQSYERQKLLLQGMFIQKKKLTISNQQTVLFILMIVVVALLSHYALSQNDTAPK